ncbi:uncharacterized protein (TIGR00156 family) [Volucribacter psittacicida]|uniref:Uncharacterized protein (TIGR00156 family) n=1 Tax=Volucribacter psittacicida TaxID=203482 RepID=A0A4V2PBL5_9PAST|nr:NirD/YgiW/YdeI family stress tolerance protein [Volucribacter psittacicida]TCJ97815.1 uncharacterized protein (TIGR00156 family) [Volucribacter psittacicida]
MKKVVLASLLALSTATAMANEAPKGGFQDPAAPAVAHHHKGKDFRQGGFVNTQQEISKVSDSSKWKDDQYILLEGNIVRQVGKDDFMFKDNSGEIEVEIERRAWAGQTITPEDKVRLYAEVDKSWNKIEVEVNRVEKIK